MDFARILLRYTFLSAEEYESILDRLIHRLDQEAKNSGDGDLALKGITFDEFKDFCLFLNNLDDFQVRFNNRFSFKKLIKNIHIKQQKRNHLHFDFMPCTNYKDRYFDLRLTYLIK